MHQKQTGIAMLLLLLLLLLFLFQLFIPPYCTCCMEIYLYCKFYLKNHECSDTTPPWAVYKHPVTQSPVTLPQLNCKVDVHKHMNFNLF